MSITELAKSSSLDITLADIRGEVTYTRLAPKKSRKNYNCWGREQPYGAFIHSSTLAVPGTKI